MKVCSRCEFEKPPADFYKDKHAPDGLNYACKECEKKRTTERRKQNPEKQRAYTAAWQAKHPEGAWASTKAWREANPDAHRETQRRYRVNKRVKQLAEKRQQLATLQAEIARLEKSLAQSIASTTKGTHDD